MSRAIVRPLAFAVLVAAAACVEIATGPDGVASIRLLPVPRAIIAGDQLRDSNGAVTTLHAVAFGNHGDTIADAAFRYTALALPRDTTAPQQVVPLVVDSITGAVRAISPTVATRGRLAVRLGDRLQVLDTILIVKKPTKLERGGTTTGADSVQSMAFLCNDTGRVATPVRFGAGAGDTVQLGNAEPMSVLLTADSTGTARPAVPSYYVRFEIVSPTKIPTAQFRGVTRPALSVVPDPNSDRVTNTDTTDQSGVATAYLRVLPSGLLPSAFADTFSVVVQASARTTPTAVVPSPVQFVVHLRRLRSTPGQGQLSGPGCGS